MIYEPKGRAREYSPLALNLYNGCDSGCFYCYLRRLPGNFSTSKAVAKKNCIERLKKSAKKYKNSDKQILLSFIGDPYCKANLAHNLTRHALEILLENRIPVSILTKGGLQCINDLSIFEEFDGHIQVGATITYKNNFQTEQYEPAAASYLDRISTLEILHKKGIKTWISFEPVVELDTVEQTLIDTVDFVDMYKIGFMNYHKLDIDKNRLFSLLKEFVGMRKIYLKKELREEYSAWLGKPFEQDPDDFCVASFDKA